MKNKNIVLSLLLVVGTTSSMLARNLKNQKETSVVIDNITNSDHPKIEKLINKRGISSLDWQSDNTATISYNSQKTNSENLAKEIAYAGYDTDTYLAPKNLIAKANNTMPGMSHSMADMSEKSMYSSKLEIVYAKYFALKDAMVSGESSSVTKASADFKKEIENIPMDELGNKEHMAWMKHKDALMSSANSILVAKDIDAQRKLFKDMTPSALALLKSTDVKQDIYLQNCPMYKGQWLSKTEDVKNPFYGSKMLSCGSVVEKIK